MIYFLIFTSEIIKNPRGYCQNTMIITKYYNKIGNPYH
ncbi:hypothetical protein MCC93_23080 [Morococcus cerebrosus]|uniref:Uncharacterized protein n=1 Tax=Morococcus cerebrosus TaxID=1056807 RepID=A0A0C1GI32_9NEIS|nr:hypothetical protein MCC93_23080 [Morococcus cerebrosus]